MRICVYAFQYYGTSLNYSGGIVVIAGSYKQAVKIIENLNEGYLPFKCIKKTTDFIQYNEHNFKWMLLVKTYCVDMHVYALSKFSPKLPFIIFKDYDSQY